MSKLIFDKDNPKSQSLTQQHFRDEVNINTIMARARKSGHLPQVLGARFLDVSQGFSYQDMVNRVLEIDELFFSLPAKVRNKFANNPEKIIAFLSDESNREEAIELGLFEKPKPEISPKPEPEPEPEPEPVPVPDV